MYVPLFVGRKLLSKYMTKNLGKRSDILMYMIEVCVSIVAGNNITN